MSRGFLPLIPAGGMLAALVIVLVAIVVLPIMAISFSPELMLLFQIAAAIMIVSWVRNIIGPGILSLGLSGILVYIFIFMLPQFTLGMYVIWTFMGFGLFQALFWGLTLFRKY